MNISFQVQQRESNQAFVAGQTRPGEKCGQQICFHCESKTAGKCGHIVIILFSSRIFLVFSHVLFTRMTKPLKFKFILSNNNMLVNCNQHLCILTLYGYIKLKIYYVLITTLLLLLKILSIVSNNIIFKLFVSHFVTRSIWLIIVLLINVFLFANSPSQNLCGDVARSNKMKTNNLVNPNYYWGINIKPHQTAWLTVSCSKYYMILIHIKG